MCDAHVVVEHLATLADPEVLRDSVLGQAVQKEHDGGDENDPREPARRSEGQRRSRLALQSMQSAA